MVIESAASHACSNTRTCKGIRGAPYDVPNQASWMNGSVDGHASYKVDGGVTTPPAWGPGVYGCFSTNNGVKLDSAIEAPTVARVQLHDMLSLSLGGAGEITHLLNSRGGAANASSNSAHLAQWAASILHSSATPERRRRFFRQAIK